jgi:aspartate/methionine/tyrosine aminotransferase
VNIPASKDNQWKLPLEELKKQITSKTKAIILNNACNPTGTLYSKEKIKEVLEIAKKHDLFVISDEVYSEINYTHHPFISCGSFPEFNERIAVVQSCSKNFGMTGWRIGFVFAERTLLQKLAVLQSQSLTSTSIVSQWAALGALEHVEEVSQYMKETMRARRDLFLAEFEELFGVALPKPSSAIYQFIDLKDMHIFHSDSISFCEKLLQEANVALVPGIAFGQEGYVRFAFSEKEEKIIQGLKKMKSFCESQIK